MINLKIVRSNTEPVTFWNGRYRFNAQLVTVTDEESGERQEWQYNELKFDRSLANPFEIYVTLVKAYCAERFPEKEEIAMLRKKLAGIDTEGEFAQYSADVEAFKAQVKSDLGLT